VWLKIATCWRYSNIQHLQTFSFTKTVRNIKCIPWNFAVTHMQCYTRLEVTQSSQLIQSAMMMAHFAAMHLNDTHCNNCVKCRWFVQNKLQTRSGTTINIQTSINYCSINNTHHGGQHLLPVRRKMPVTQRHIAPTSWITVNHSPNCTEWL
jgi:hypothetical protein